MAARSPNPHSHRGRLGRHAQPAALRRLLRAGLEVAGTAADGASALRPRDPFAPI